MAQRLVTVTKDAKGYTHFGKVVHISDSCVVLEKKEYKDYKGTDLANMPPCKICLHYKIGDYKSFPEVVLSQNIIIKIEAQYGKTEEELLAEEEAREGSSQDDDS